MNLFYYVDKGKQLGPVSLKDLENKVNSNEISVETKIWKEGMSDWVKFSDFNKADSQPPSDTKVESIVEEPKILKNLLLASVMACLVFLLNPFSGFALVYALQAQNAFRDGRQEDMATKVGLCKKMLLVATILSLIIYSVATALYLGILPIPSAIQSTFS